MKSQSIILWPNKRNPDQAKSRKTGSSQRSPTIYSLNLEETSSIATPTEAEMKAFTMNNTQSRKNIRGTMSKAIAIVKSPMKMHLAISRRHRSMEHQRPRWGRLWDISRSISSVIGVQGPAKEIEDLENSKTTRNLSMRSPTSRKIMKSNKSKKWMARPKKDKRIIIANNHPRVNLCQSAPREAKRKKKGQKGKSLKAGETRVRKKMRCFLRRFSMKIKMLERTRLSRNWRKKRRKSRLILSMKWGQQMWLIIVKSLKLLSRGHRRLKMFAMLRLSNQSNRKITLNLSSKRQKQ